MKNVHIWRCGYRVKERFLRHYYEGGDREKKFNPEVVDLIQNA